MFSDKIVLLSTNPNPSAVNVKRLQGKRGLGRLVGAPVMASDLRGPACLVLAGLAAKGTTTVSRVYHLDRGYVRMEQTLAALGANITRFDDADTAEPAAAPSDQALIASSV